MNTLNNDELSLIKEFNSNQIINSTLDITDNSVLFINHESKEKLEKYIREALDKNLQTIVTSENCSISNEKIIKVKNYEEKYNEVLIKLCPGYQGKNFYGIKIVKNAGHWVQQEQSKKVFELLNNFYKSQKNN